MPSSYTARSPAHESPNTYPANASSRSSNEIPASFSAPVPASRAMSG